MKAEMALGLIGVLVGGFILLMAITSVKPESVEARIRRECHREYGAQGTRAVEDCFINTSVRYLSDRQAERADRVYDRVR